MPSSGAPARPAAGRAESRLVRCSSGSRPRKPSPTRIVTTPKTRLSASACSSSSRPRPPKAAPNATKTAVKPRTNSSAPVTMRVRGETWVRTAVTVVPDADASAAGAPVPTSPETYARYPGTSGSTQGEAKLISPTSAATPAATSSGPSVTSERKVSPTSLLLENAVDHATQVLRGDGTGVDRSHPPLRVDDDGGRDRVRREVAERQRHLPARVVQRGVGDGEPVDEGGGELLVGLLHVHAEELDARGEVVLRDLAEL